MRVGGESALQQERSRKRWVQTRDNKRLERIFLDEYWRSLYYHIELFSFSRSMLVAREDTPSTHSQRPNILP